MGHKRDRMGMPGYARILHSIMKKRGTKRDIRSRGLCHHTAAWRIVSEFHALELIHVAAWREVPGQPRQPVYAFGQAQDAKPPAFRPDGVTPSRTRPLLKAKRIGPDMRGFFAVWEALQAPTSKYEIELETGVTWKTLTTLFATMRELRMVYIADWQRKSTGGKCVALYLLGDKDDTPYPKADQKAQKVLWRRNTALRHLPHCFLQLSGPQA